MAHRFDDAEDDYNPLGEHVVDLPARHHALGAPARRSYATLAIGGLVALAAIAIPLGFILDHAQRAREEATQRDELSVGWQMLGSLAANGARADASSAAAPTPTVMEASPAPNVVVVNVPAPAPPNAVPSAVSNEPGTAQPAANGPAPAPIAGQGSPNAGVGVQPIVSGSLAPGNAAAEAQPNGAQQAAAVPAQPQPNGAQQAAASEPALPPGGVPSSGAVQSLPGGSVLSPITFPASQMCGLSTCDTGSVCCNASCGICTAPGASCSQQAC